MRLDILDNDETESRKDWKIPIAIYGVVRYLFLLYFLYRLCMLGLDFTLRASSIFTLPFGVILVTVSMLYQLEQGKYELRDKSINKRLIPRMSSIISTLILICIYLNDGYNILYSLPNYIFTSDYSEVIIVVLILLLISKRDILQIPKEIEEKVSQEIAEN